MYKIKIISVGKTKETWLEEALKEYTKRLQSIVQFEWIYPKDNKQLVLTVPKDVLVLCLDPSGELLDSETFSKKLMHLLEKGGSRMTLVIGGPEGLPAELKALPAISLSPLTFTHQIVRLVLIEQIYRAFEIDKGSGYHK